MRDTTGALRLFAGIALVAQLCACASVETLTDDYETPSPLPRSYLEQFCYEPAPVEKLLVVVGAIVALDLLADHLPDFFLRQDAQQGSGLSDTEHIDKGPQEVSHGKNAGKFSVIANHRQCTDF